MDAAKEYLKLREKLRDVEQEVASVEGKLELLNNTLMEEHGCKDVAAARKKLEEYNVGIEKLRKKLVKKLEAFSAAWDGSFAVD